MKTYFNQIGSVALNLFKEGIRSKAVLIFIVIFILFFGFTHILSKMAVGESTRVILNGGFWFFGIMGVVNSVYFTSSIIKKEVDRKTLYIILSRPVSRTAFYSGCFIGIIFNVLTAYSTSVLIWFVFLKIHGISISFSLILCILFIGFEWVLLCALGLMFATFTSPLLNSFFVVCIYFVGHLSRSLYIYSENVKEIFLKKVLLLIYYVFPNLEALNFRAEALYNASIPPEQIFLGFTTVISWILTAFIAGVILFQGRKLI